MHAPLLSRRRALRIAVGAGCASAIPAALAQTAADQAAAIAQFAGGQAIRSGRVTLEIAPLVDNGNVVPMRVRVDSPMTAADHVAEIAVFNEKNPQRDVVRYLLGPASGRADVSTRIRLATSQKLIALARMNDGSVWSGAVDVVVVLAACIEGEG